MQIEEKDVTLAGFVITWLVGIFGYGRGHGKLSAKVDNNETEIEAIKQAFITVDGEPRLMSYAAHDKISAACQLRMTDRLDDHTKKLDNQAAKIDKILEVVSGLAAINK